MNKHPIIANTLDIVVDEDDNFYLIFNIKGENTSNMKLTKEQAIKAVIAIVKTLGDL